MKIYTEEQIDKLFSNSGSFEEFKKFIKEYGLDEQFINITSKHTKKRLETLISLAEDSKKQHSEKKRELMQTILCKLEDAKKHSEEVEVLRAAYKNQDIIEEMDLEELFEQLRKYCKNYEKHKSIQKHEERIANKWIKDLTAEK